MDKIRNSKNTLLPNMDMVGELPQNGQLENFGTKMPLGNKTKVITSDMNLSVSSSSSPGVQSTDMFHRDVQEMPQVKLSEENIKIKANQGKILNVLGQYCAPVSIPENEFGVKSGMCLDVYSMAKGLEKKWDALVGKGELTKEKRDAQAKDVENVLNLVKDKEDISLVRVFTESFFGKGTNFYEKIDKTSGEQIAKETDAKLQNMKERASEHEKEGFVQTLNELLEKSKKSSLVREFLGLAIIARKHCPLHEKEGLNIVLLEKEKLNDSSFSGYDRDSEHEDSEVTLKLAKFYEGDDLHNVYSLLNIFHEIGHMVLYLMLNECAFDKWTRMNLDNVCMPYYDENDLRSNFFRELGGLGAFRKDEKSMDEIDKAFWGPWDGYMDEQMQMLGMFLCQDTLFLNSYWDLPLSIAAHEVWPDIAVYLRPTHKEDIDVNDVKRMGTIDNICSENFEKTKSFLQDVRNNNSEGCLFGNFLQSLRDELDGFKAPEELFCISSDKVSEIGEKISRKMNLPLTGAVVGTFDDLGLFPLWSDKFKEFFAEVSKTSLKDETFSHGKLDEYLGRYFLLSMDDDNREWTNLSLDKKRENARELRIEFEDLREKAEKLIETKDFGAQVDPQLIDNVA